MKHYYFCSADRTPDFNGSLLRAERDCSEKMVLFFYLKNTGKNSVMEHSEFSDLLKLQNLSLFKSYLKTHRLNESDEYQMVVTLAMELEDEYEAEKIICGYIRRYGLCSLKSKQVLKDLGFKKALRIVSAQELLQPVSFYPPDIVF